ncbi:MULTISPECIES: bacteriocin immunity protein [Lactobacillus]|uniref:Bacteriocin immunity protein n=1 Tax=Lactobacillus xujianguonis TaxID=2495899 RepID=A0A437SVD5_9LACO|nr:MULTISPECIES: bacteriocin immunity protein [Lactobacillus]RVU70884.1 bacteriocin immunity protein [Lactobacillus xujianguonis]RVU73769.1 bacteriocin immunity protein [Lactobacillus xujianguonis]
MVKRKYPEGKPMLGVGVLNDLSPKNNDFVIKIRSLINANPEVVANPDVMKFLKLALFRTSSGEPVTEVAKALDDELSGYLLKNHFKASVGVRKLQEELKFYTEVL